MKSGFFSKTFSDASASSSEEKSLAKKIYNDLNYLIEEEVAKEKISSLDFDLLNKLKLHPEILKEEFAINLFQRALEFRFHASIGFFIGMDFQVPQDIQEKMSKRFYPPFNEAILKGYPRSFIETLINNNFNMNFIVDGITELDCAIAEKNTEFVEWLKKHGALTTDQVKLSQNTTALEVSFLKF